MGGLTAQDLSLALGGILKVVTIPVLRENYRRLLILNCEGTKSMPKLVLAKVLYSYLCNFRDLALRHMRRKPLAGFLIFHPWAEIWGPWGSKMPNFFSIFSNFFDETLFIYGISKIQLMVFVSYVWGLILSSLIDNGAVLWSHST